MGFISEIFSAIRDISQMSTELKDDTFNMEKRYSSISRRSMEGIMHFPVIVSRTIDIETMQMISKALEKQFASFAQTAITMSPFLNIKNDKNAVNYLSKFHQNTHMRNNLFDDAFNALGSFDAASEGMVNLYGTDDQTVFALISVAEGSSKGIVMANRKGLVDLMEGIRQESINDLYKPQTRYRFKDKANQMVYAKEDAHVDNRYSNQSTKADSIRNEYGDVHIRVDNSKGLPGVGAMGAGGNKIIDYQLPNNVLKDNDVKKANELVPTSMHIRVILTDEESRTVGNMDFIAGVKATLHPVPAEEMVENISNSIRRGGKLFKTLRWTSGEISFAKDYVLNLTEIKDDATKEKTGNSQWWTALKRRAKLSKLKKYTFLQRDLLPNATLVLSIEEAEHLKNNYNIDVLNPKVAYKLMNEYYLISFVVVDSAKGIVHFLFDGHTEYQDVTFSGLERGDIAGRGVDFKDVLKLVQRV